MTDKFTDMLRRKLTVSWDKDEGPLDLRNHSAGIGGIHSMAPPQPVINAMAALKPRMIRIFLQEFFFIYPDHGVYDWTKLDAYMAAVHAMGGDIMATICIKPKVLYPELDPKIWMPNDVAEWQEIIRTLVLRYSKEKPYVTHWGISNEPNIGEFGGCPYQIESPDDMFEYYKITAAPIREALSDVPGIKVGGPHYAGARGGAEYLGRFVELCKLNNVPLDFTCYNMYSNDPYEHQSDARGMRDSIDKHMPGLPFYMTEFNIGIGEELTVEEKAFDAKRAACQAASILAFHEDGALDGTFQYHIYDQFNDPREFAPFYTITRYMAEHWNDRPHRCGLTDLDGKLRPQYYLYQLLYSLSGRRVALAGTERIYHGIASSSEGTLSVFIANYGEKGTPDAVAQLRFEAAPAGVYRLNVYRIDKESAAEMKTAGIDNPPQHLTPTESRITYVHPDFRFDVYTPADSVTLVQLKSLA